MLAYTTASATDVAFQSKNATAFLDASIVIAMAFFDCLTNGQVAVGERRIYQTKVFVKTQTSRTKSVGDGAHDIPRMNDQKHRAVHVSS